MGAKRAADGHAEQYKVKYFELGNEQYNANYVEQVAAMEAKVSCN
jgi:alpha-L-arabinofuranosidase